MAIKRHTIKYPQFLAGLLNSFDTVTSVKNHVSLPAEGLRVCLLRHDVDHRLDLALSMARQENAVGIKSTFFLLHTAPYYKATGFVDACREIVSLGHEIGIHNNFITQRIAEKDIRPNITIADMLNEEIKYFEDNGIKIYGTASHGDKLCRELDFRNYEIFRGCYPEYGEKKKSVESIPLHTVDMHEINLYEAYFLPIEQNLYLTDSGCQWRSRYEEWHPKFLKREVIPDVLMFLKKSNNAKIAQILTHPVWWR